MDVGPHNYKRGRKRNQPQPAADDGTTACGRPPGRHQRSMADSRRASLSTGLHRRSAQRTSGIHRRETEAAAVSHVH
jgi:hypothetical protein